MLGNAGLIHVHDIDPQSKRSSCGTHGEFRVATEVEKDLMHLRWVREHRADVLSNVGLNGNGGWQQGA
jgi:hypothetical protein